MSLSVGHRVGGEPVLLRGGKTVDLFPRPSPDGRLVAYMSFGTGEPKIFLTRLPGGEGRWQVTVEGGWWPRWRGDGRALFFALGDGLYEVAVRGGPGE